MVPSPDDTIEVIASIPYLGSAGTGRGYVYLGAGHAAIEKPVVVVEGFDLDDTLDWDELYEMLNQEMLIETLRARGFDTVVLDFTAATDYIQRNAFVLVELIQQVRAISGPSTLNEARIWRTRSYGAKAEVISAAWSTLSCPSGPSVSTISTPSRRRSLARRRVSARRGMLVRRSGWSVRRLAAISLIAEFLAPLMGIDPFRDGPPVIAIRSILSLRSHIVKARLKCRFAGAARKARLNRPRSAPVSARAGRPFAGANCPAAPGRAWLLSAPWDRAFAAASTWPIDGRPPAPRSRYRGTHFRALRRAYVSLYAPFLKRAAVAQW